MKITHGHDRHNSIGDGLETHRCHCICHMVIQKSELNNSTQEALHKLINSCRADDDFKPIAQNYKLKLHRE